MTDTRLDPHTLTCLREQADRDARGFIDPRALRRARDLLPRLPKPWVAGVLGDEQAPAGLSLPWAQQLLLLTAADVDAEHLAHLAEHEPRLSRVSTADPLPAAHDRLTRAQWQELAARLPVPVVVAHHYSRHHYEGGNPDRDHVVVQADLHHGRWHRQAGQALCETPSHRLPHLDDPEDHRVPTCRACLHALARLTVTD